MLILDLQKEHRGDSIPGECAHCHKPVWESVFTLDDAYNVWAGKCPYCGAINLLSLEHGLRGYCSSKMWLVLPCDEERDSNGLPADCPTCGKGGELAPWLDHFTDTSAQVNRRPADMKRSRSQKRRAAWKAAALALKLKVR